MRAIIVLTLLSNGTSIECRFWFSQTLNLNQEFSTVSHFIKCLEGQHQHQVFALTDINWKSTACYKIRSPGWYLRGVRPRITDQPKPNSQRTQNSHGTVMDWLRQLLLKITRKYCTQARPRPGQTVCSSSTVTNEECQRNLNVKRASWPRSWCCFSEDPSSTPWHVNSQLVCLPPVVICKPDISLFQFKCNAWDGTS